MDRRRFLKYAGATVAVIGASALGLDSLLSPQRATPNLTSVTSTFSSLNSYTSAIESTATSTPPPSTFSDLEGGYPQLAQALNELPNFSANSLATQRISTLALQSDDSRVKEAFDLMLRGGVNTELHTPYSVPSWNTELEVLYWLAEQNQFERDDALAQAVAMVNGIWISLGTDDVQQAVYSDCNDMLNFLRDTNELQKTWGASQLEDYPLDALAALAWSGNDLGRGGHIHYCLISDKSCQPSHYPLNIHHFIENIDRQVTLKDYRWNTVSVQTLRQLQQTVVQRPWLGQDANVTADNLENYFYVGPNNRGFSFAHWNFTEPNDEFINVNGEQTIDHNMNNANFEYQYFTKTDGGIGVCDDNMTLINAFLKSCGVASTALTRTYGIVNGLNHTHAIYYDPSSDSWKGAQGELLIGFTDTGFSTNWNVYIARPPILQHNYFNSEPDSKQKFMIMLDIYYKMLGVDSDQITSMFTSGVPTSTTHDWFLTLH